MYAQVEKPKENKSRAVANLVAQKKSNVKQSFEFVDNRPETVAQRQLKEMVKNSPQVKQAAQLLTSADNYKASPQPLIQKKENATGYTDNLKTGTRNLSDDQSNFQNVLQPRALSIGKINMAACNQKQNGTVVQRALLDVGQNAHPGPSVQSQGDVLAAGPRNDTLLWPSGVGHFNGDYAGSVLRAMEWGLQGGEGTAGWYGRVYSAADFHAIATAAENASNNLVGIHASLNNNKNKTLVAIRAFRGPNNGSMAGQTEADLCQVYAVVNGQAAALHGAGLINNAAANVTLIEADPAEAHPNTLPTAKIIFGAAGTVYFKGRGRAVENALVGSGPSAARALSSIAGANPDGAAGVGMHGFVTPGGPNPSQIAGDVGNEVAPVLTPVTATETAHSYLPTFLGGADIPPRPEAIAAWLSVAKGALLASLTATTDLHPSNIVAGRSGKKHIIDGEFLLDVTQWQAYQDMLAGGAIANFNVGSFVPPWLQTHMATLSQGTKALMANAVVTSFIALGADKTHVWAEIIEPIRELIKAPALLRVIPLATDDFLRWVTNYNNEPNALARVILINQLWTDIDNEMNGIITITMANAAAGRAELSQNLRNGMVPLFHVRSNDGIFMLNKAINIGNTVIGHNVEDLLIQAGAAVSRRYADMAEMVRTRIRA